MKNAFYVFIAAIVISSSAMADLELDLKRCSVRCSRLCAETISRARGLLQSADTNCDSANSVKDECMNYIVDKGYQPSDAKQACNDINKHNIGCLKHLVNKGYTPAASNSACVGASKSQIDCIIDLVDQGYAPDYARNSCM